MNKKITVLGGLLMAVVMTAYSVSGTYAKYTSTFTGSDSARVAKWAFNIDGTAVTNTFTFDLFNTIAEADGITTEEDVMNISDPADGQTVIAPGTGGKFDIKLQNLSEVTAKYYVKLSETANADSIPIEYSTDGSNYKSLADINLELKGTEEASAMKPKASEATKTIYWRWAFTGGESTNYTATQTDATDTALGVAGTASITVQAEVIVTQVD